MKVSGNNTSNIEPIPSGMHVGTCFGLVDLGTHDSEWKGEIKQKREVLIMWELPEERIEIEKDGEKKDLPRVISKRYTMSIGEKANLGADLRSWRGRDFTKDELDSFELRNILGAPCLLNIVHRESSGNTYANVATVSPLMKNQAKPNKESEQVYFSFEDYEDASQPLPEALPEWVQKIITESKEYQALQRMAGDSDEAVRAEEVPMGGEDTLDEDVPF